MADNTATNSLATPPLWRWLAWAGVVLIVDQITKVLILQHYQLGDATPITGFFNIVRAHNTGAAFSLLADAGGWQRWGFMAIAVVAAIVIIWQLRANPTQKLFCFALASILGGAIGNVIDRMLYGYVVDFLDFYAAGWHFAAFNVADMGITLGAICVVLDELLRMRARR